MATVVLGYLVVAIVEDSSWCATRFGGTREMAVFLVSCKNYTGFQVEPISLPSASQPSSHVAFIRTWFFIKFHKFYTNYHKMTFLTIATFN